MIYGTVLLAACMLVGRWLGAILATMLGLDANVGGVGFAMVALMAAMAGLRRAGLATPSLQAGIGYWAGVYIPIVVAMAATQNVVGAVRGGPVAIAAGVGTVVCGFLAVPLLARRPDAARSSTRD